ncbi:hypothetical protein K450DRAFT_252957 [Umbelopsis ramanniana AG]|uniref:Uncharacterized protein n=1 Tax=Umbelopsis ramanniana AG TaxID=1314678 RepID=A0AAD5E4X3_UMBRA|nr:uncharacterized protein K450DRAFT_252957 [Umbelopsis ramanniana AG]KAI8577253.1 hypothetical protein K450DRAFT_252957 [Umbelopsis ramanniana AG]
MNVNGWIAHEAAQRRRLRPRNPFIGKWCLCMSLRGGSTFANLVWLGLNLYLTVLSFESRSPIYSYLNYTAFMVTGVISLVFCLVTLWTLFALFQNKAHILRLSHMLTWCAVIAFLTDSFINIIVFGVLRGDYETWCLDKSRNYVDEQVTAILGNGTQITMSFNPSQNGMDLYNCHKMWEDELKLGIVVWIVFTIIYMYWAACLWSYAQKKRMELIEAHAINDQPNMMMNLPPGGDINEAAWEDSHGKSMAEGVREIYSGLRSMLNRNRVPPEETVKFG